MYMKIQKEVGVVATCQVIIDFNLRGHITCERILAIQTVHIMFSSFVHLTQKKTNIVNNNYLINGNNICQTKHKICWKQQTKQHQSLTHTRKKNMPNFSYTTIN